MNLSNIESQNKSNIEKSASPTSRPKKPPVIPVHHTLVADVVSMGEHVAHERRAAYRMLELRHPDIEETEMVILPAAKEGDDTLLRAVPALYDAGVRRLTLYLASADSWKHRRVEGVGLHMPTAPVASIAVPLQESPKAEPPAALRNEGPVKPTIAPVVLEGERLQGKRYNTSDGFDRQVIRLPGKGPLSALFQGSGFYKWLKFGDMFIVVPVTQPTPEQSRQTFKSAAALKNGDREIYFHGMARASKHGKANAPTIFFTAAPEQGGMKLQRAK